MKLFKLILSAVVGLALAGSAMAQVPGSPRIHTKKLVPYVPEIDLTGIRGVAPSGTFFGVYNISLNKGYPFYAIGGGGPPSPYWCSGGYNRITKAYKYTGPDFVYPAKNYSVGRYTVTMAGGTFKAPGGNLVFTISGNCPPVPVNGNGQYVSATVLGTSSVVIYGSPMSFSLSAQGITGGNSGDQNCYR